MRRIIKYIIFSMAVFFLFIGFKLYLIEKEFFYKAIEYEKNRQSVEAFLMYERVILAYIPRSQLVTKSLDRMEKICSDLKDYDRINCFDSMRSSIYQIRFFYLPFRDRLARIDEELIRLKTNKYMKENSIPAQKYNETEKIFRNITEYNPYPSDFWSFLAVISLLGWLCSILLIILKGLAEPVNKRVLFFGCIGFLIFFSSWILGLYMA